MSGIIVRPARAAKSPGGLGGVPFRAVVLLVVGLLVGGLLIGSCAGDDEGSAPKPSAANSSTSAGTPDELTTRIVTSVPHDPGAFTQGLLFSAEARLYESVGQRGSSEVREVDPGTGGVLQRQSLGPEFFGEGLAEGPSGLVQLTWEEERAFLWGVDRLEPLGGYDYEGEGWGLTFDGLDGVFVQSDGSGVLTVRDPVSFDALRTITVLRDGRPVDDLNELEWVEGTLYANVWHSDEILRIDPVSGEVSGVVDASGLWTSPERTGDMTLNGIARRPGDPVGRLWLTGKNWPEMFVVDVVPA